MAHFMDEHDHGQHKEERHERAKDEALCAEKRVKNLVQDKPSNSSAARIAP
jgi:hypothetical protein